MRTLSLAFLLLFVAACRHPEKPETIEEKTMNKVAESTKKKSIDDFFSTYELNFNKGLSEGITSVSEAIISSFSNCFVESSPAGVMCGTNDDGFLQEIEQGLQFYKKIGSQSMKITSKEITDLDDLHSMAKIGWRYTAIKDGREVVIDFQNIYMLVIQNNQPKIFAYIAGDEQRALKENGLMD
jgi:hypothetical protein